MGNQNNRQKGKVEDQAENRRGSFKKKIDAVLEEMERTG